MRKIIGFFLIQLMFPLCAMAQRGDVIRGHCTPGIVDDGVAETRGSRRLLPAINTDWNPNRIYRQAVVLLSFADKDFSMENPRETYDSVFNVAGYNNGAGPGCVAEYFREQSGGLLNLQFDVYGPYKVSYNAKINPKSTSAEYGTVALKEAARLWIAEDSLRAYRDYDWNGDGYVNQIIYVYAGYAGNQNADECKGCIWPNTSSMGSILTPDGFKVSSYTCSGEVKTNGKSWGIGTICHEFTHSLGLPDIYPTSSNAGFSVVDEWDLMDGGNFINGGWCPPNYSGLERMLMGWQSPIELTEATTITDMKSLSEGGPVYMVRHTDSEYFLLENRQWSGWDQRIPGRGLVIFHVNYKADKWRGNTVNNNVSLRGYQLVHADSLDYDAWADIIGSNNPYVNGHSRILSTSAYPWSTDSTDFVNDCLTDTSTPSSLMYTDNEDGNKYLSKAITNIRVSDEGLVSFEYHGYVPSEISKVSETIIGHYDNGDAHWYNLQGRRLLSEPSRRGLYIHKGKLVSKH